MLRGNIQSDTPLPETDSVHRYSQSTRSIGNGESHSTSYRVDEFVQDAINLKITPFMLDQYANEYEELVRKRDAHAIEVDSLRTTNRTLSNQVYALRCVECGQN